MFGWLKRKPRTLAPESKWVISMDNGRISVRDDAGAVRSILKDHLSGIAIETNDSGPWGADVWWLLFGKDDQLACASPQGATGEDTMIDYFTALPSFDHGEMIKAMASTDNAVFAVWRRSTE